MVKFSNLRPYKHAREFNWVASLRSSPRTKPTSHSHQQPHTAATTPCGNTSAHAPVLPHHAGAHSAHTYTHTVLASAPSASSMSLVQVACRMRRRPTVHEGLHAASAFAPAPSASSMSLVRTVCRIMQAPTTRMPRGSRPAHSADTPCVWMRCRIVVRQFEYSGCACVHAVAPLCMLTDHFMSGANKQLPSIT